MMGGMGRDFDGSYAELTRVPRRSVYRLRTELPWETLGALPEMFQTSQGSLRVGLRAKAGESLFIRGGTSSIGLCVAAIAKRHGMVVASSSRSESKRARLETAGATHVLLDDGSSMKAKVEEAFGDGADCVLDLVGTKTLKDSLRCCRDGGRVCMTGMLGGEWVWKDFEPFVDVPNGVFLTSYGGESENITEPELQDFVDDVEAGRVAVSLDRTFALDDIVEAHRYMEANRARGKIVALP